MRFDKMSEEVVRFTGLLQATFDPDRYPRLSDGVGFDEELVRLENAFEKLKKLFDDFLMASWSTEISQGARKRR